MSRKSKSGISSNSRGGGDFSPVGSNAVAYDGISGLPNKIGPNQKWVLQRVFSVEGGKRDVEEQFEGKGTYGVDSLSTNHGFEYEGWKSTASLKKAYKERTESVKVGDQAWTGKHDSNGKMIWGKVTKNKYRPVLLTLR